MAIEDTVAVRCRTCPGTKLGYDCPECQGRGYAIRSREEANADMALSLENLAKYADDGEPYAAGVIKFVEDLTA